MRKRIALGKLKTAFLFLSLALIVAHLHAEDLNSEGSGQIETENNYSGDPEPDPNKKVYTPVLYGKLGYSLLTGENIIIGLDLGIDGRKPWQWEWMFIEHVIGFDYQYKFNTNESILRLNYIRTLFLLGGAGVSFSYNINTSNIGIAPQIGINYYFFLTLFLTAYYRYNITPNDMDSNFHEIALAVNVLLR